MNHEEVNHQDKKALEARKLELLKQAVEIGVLAKDAYDTTNTKVPAGWKLLASSSPAAPMPGAPGFFAKVYERTGPIPKGGSKYAVAFRGTTSLPDVRNSDIESDIAIALRKIPPQYAQGLAFVESVCKKNNINPAEMAFVGHSLGGYLAITVGETLGAGHIWTFNSPGPDERTRNQLIHKIPGVSASPGDGLVQVRSIYDIIAQWGYREGIIIGIKTAGNHHSLDSLLQAVNATINGQLPIDPVRECGLAEIFNAVSQRLATSADVKKEIKKLFDNIPHWRHRQGKPPGSPAFG